MHRWWVGRWMGRWMAVCECVDDGIRDRPYSIITVNIFVSRFAAICDMLCGVKRDKTINMYER